MLKTKPTSDHLWQWHCASLDLPEPYEASQLIANQAYAAGASSRDDEIETLRYEVDAIAGIKAERDALQTRIRQLCDLVRRVHKAKGRYHTQLAICDLYESVGLPFERPNQSSTKPQPKE